MRCICFYSGQFYSMAPMPTDVATTSAPVPQNDLDVVLAVAAIALAVIVLVVIAVVAIGFAKKKITKRCVHSCTTTAYACMYTQDFTALCDFYSLYIKQIVMYKIYSIGSIRLAKARSRVKKVQRHFLKVHHAPMNPSVPRCPRNVSRFYLSMQEAQYLPRYIIISTSTSSPVTTINSTCQSAPLFRHSACAASRKVLMVPTHRTDSARWRLILIVVKLLGLQHQQPCESYEGQEIFIQNGFKSQARSSVILHICTP